MKYIFSSSLFKNEPFFLLVPLPVQWNSSITHCQVKSMVFADMNILIMHDRNTVNSGGSLDLYSQLIIISIVLYVII